MAKMYMSGGAVDGGAYVGRVTEATVLPAVTGGLTSKIEIVRDWDVPVVELR
jgi:hypothetical protein